MTVSLPMLYGLLGATTLKTTGLSRNGAAPFLSVSSQTLEYITCFLGGFYKLT